MSCFPATNPRLQAVKIHSGASRDLCLERLASSDVRRAEASFPADKVRWWCCRCFEHQMWWWWWCHLGMRFGRGRCEVKSKWGWLVGWLAGLLVTSFQRSGDGSGSRVTDPHHHHPDPPGLGLGQNRGHFSAGIAVVAKHLVLGQLFLRPPETRRPWG